MGYIEAHLRIVGLDATGGNLSSLANLFSSIDQINEEIEEQFSWAWRVAAHSQRVNEIKCIFGEALIDFKCEVFPSVERLRSNTMNSSLIYS